MRVKRYAQNFTTNHKIKALDSSDRDTLNRFADLLRIDSIVTIDDEQRIMMTERVGEVFDRDIAFRTQD